MRARMIIGGVLVAATAGLSIPALATPAKSTPTPPAACVIVTGPHGAILQVGYAPNGPSDCHKLP